MRHRDGRHTAGIIAFFAGSLKNNIGIAPIHARRRSGLPFTLALPIATTLTLALTAISPSSLTGGKTSEIAGHVPFVLANGPEGLIVTVAPDRAGELAARWRVRIYHSADSRCWSTRFIGHAYAGSGNLATLSVLANRHLVRSMAGDPITSRLRL